MVCDFLSESVMVCDFSGLSANVMVCDFSGQFVNKCNNAWLFWSVCWQVSWCVTFLVALFTSVMVRDFSGQFVGKCDGAWHFLSVCKCDSAQSLWSICQQAWCCVMFLVCLSASVMVCDFSGLFVSKCGGVWCFWSVCQQAWWCMTFLVQVRPPHGQEATQPPTHRTWHRASFVRITAHTTLSPSLSLSLAGSIHF